MFWTVLAAYLVGWLLVNVIFNRVLAYVTRNQERLDRIKAKGQREFAVALADELIDRRWQQYPYDDGDVLVIGPEAFVGEDSQGRSVISWRGENYVPQ